MPTKPTLNLVSPRKVIAGLGGVQSLKKVASNAETYDSVRRFGEAFYEAYIDGYGERWNSQAEMASVLGVSESIVKRLMAARNRPDYIRGMPYAEIVRIARFLKIPTEGLEDRRKIELDVLGDVVAAMWAVRQGSDPATSPTETERIRVVADLVDRCDGGDLVGWVGEDDFDSWVGEMLEAIHKANPPLLEVDSALDEEVSNLVVSAGDWLAARQYLSVFVERLFETARTVCDDSESYSASLVSDAKQTISGLAEVNKLLSAFRKAKNGTIEDVARELKLKYVKAVYRLLERVELAEDDFRDSDGELGRLIMKSPNYRRKAEALLAVESEYGSGPKDGERRPR